MKRSEIGSRSMWFADSDREGEEEGEDMVTIHERDMDRTLLAWWWHAYFEGAATTAQPRNLWLRVTASIAEAHRIKNMVEEERSRSR